MYKKQHNNNKKKRKQNKKAGAGITAMKLNPHCFLCALKSQHEHQARVYLKKLLKRWI